MKMKGHVCKESWSRCEHPSMLYDTVRNPRATHIPPKVILNPNLDTIESTQKRLNNEMLHRLKNLGLQLPHESFVAVVQVGKYVFLAVMLPPYLMLYTFPRWLIVSFFPQLITEAKAAMMTIGKYVNIMAKQVTDLMKGIMDQLLGDALRMTRDRSKNFLRHLRDIANKVIETITQNSNRLQAWQTQLKQVMTKTTTDILASIKNVIETASKWVATVTREAAKKVSEQIVKMAQFFDKNVLTPTIELMLPPMQWMGNKFNAFKHGVAHYAKAAGATIQRGLAAVFAPIEEGIKWAAKEARKLVDKVADPVVAWMKETNAVIVDYAQAAWRTIADPVAAAAEKVKEWAATSVEMVKHLMVIPSGLMQAVKWAWGFVPQETLNKMQSRKETLQKFGSRTKSLAKGVVSGLREIVAASRRLVIRSRGWLQKLGTLLLRGVRWIVGHMLLLPRYLARIGKVAGRGFLTTCGYFVFVARLFIAIAWAVCYLGYYVLRQANR